MSVLTVDRRPQPVAVPTPRTVPRVKLTPRVHEVVALAREGARTRDIGRRLGIPTRAVEALLRDARRKLTVTENAR